MFSHETLIVAAAQELEEAISWFNREVKLWRALGDDDKHEDGSETICFRPSRGIDIDGFEQKLRISLHILNRITAPKMKENDNAAQPET